MDTRKYRTYSREFKLEALGLLESSDKSLWELERESGITTGLLGYSREIVGHTLAFQFFRQLRHGRILST